jgi:mono/diheme cytochrome c family protein
MKSSALNFSLAFLTIGAALSLGISVAMAQQSGGTSKNAKLSVWDGVYTKAQDARGREVHDGACAACHGNRLNGAGQPDMPPAPAIARAAFLHKWAGQTVAALFDYVRTKMPPDNPGSLSDQEAIDAIAHMFAASNIPAGAKELPPDPQILSGIAIKERAK